MTLSLGIETTCDETSVSIVEDGRNIRSNVVASQEDIHRKYGGVLPEAASRAHVRALLPVLQESCDQAGVDLEALDQICVASTPGLIGSLLIGVQGAKALALTRDLPLIGVNHIDAHLYSCALAAINTGETSLEEFPFPQIGMVVSGGHTGIYKLHSHEEYEKLGSTVDDAAGECFDKVAAMLSLPYPGGPSIENAAREGNPGAFDFPRPMLESGDYRFSFSGLKTAVLYHLEDHFGNELHKDNFEVPEPILQNTAASMQEAVADTLVGKIQQGLNQFHGMKGISVGGGVAANERIRKKLTTLCQEHDLPLFIPPLSLCTDNGAMIAGKGYHLSRHQPPDSLQLTPVPT